MICTVEFYSTLHVPFISAFAIIDSNTQLHLAFQRSQTQPFPSSSTAVLQGKPKRQGNSQHSVLVVKDTSLQSNFYYHFSA